MANSIVEVVAHKDTVDLETNLVAMKHNVNIPKSNKTNTQNSRIEAVDIVVVVDSHQHDNTKNKSKTK